MTILRASGRALYWIAVGYIPVAIFQFTQRYEQAIGCPASGECYVTGSEHLLYLEMLEAYAAVFLWPLVVWNLWKLVRAFRGKGQGDT
jgi:hypothetical protein